MVLLIYSCKTFTIDESLTHDIPSDIELIKIPAGAFTSGSSNNIQFIEYDYEMMKYPVTNAQYVEFLKEAFASGDVDITNLSVTGFYEGDKNWPAGIYEFADFDDPDSRIGFNPPDDFVIKSNFSNNRLEGYDYHPVIEVTWFGANAFTEYYGMSLPTKEEWEKAARANTGYIFPWGFAMDINKVNFLDSGDTYDNDTSPVGFFDGRNNTTDSYSPYGIYDLCGNVSEWTTSWKNQSPGKVIKGGSWLTKPIAGNGKNNYIELYTWFEPSYGYSPNNSSSDIGFRCVKKSE